MAHNFVVKPRDICRIIKECAKSQVSEFRFGTLYLVFGPRDPLAPRSLGLSKTKTSEQALKITEEAMRQQRAESFRQDLEELRLTDPSAFEQIIQGDLEVGGEQNP